VSSKSINKGDVTFSKYSPEIGNWNELSTTYKGEDGTYYYYTTTLNHFSLFAISERTKSIPEQIISEITKSYREASKHLITLIVWWLVFFILVVAILLVLLLMVNFVVDNREHILDIKYINVHHPLKK